MTMTMTTQAYDLGAMIGRQSRISPGRRERARLLREAGIEPTSETVSAFREGVAAGIDDRLDPDNPRDVEMVIDQRIDYVVDFLWDGDSITGIDEIEEVIADYSIVPRAHHVRRVAERVGWWSQWCDIARRLIAESDTGDADAIEWMDLDDAIDHAFRAHIEARGRRVHARLECEREQAAWMAKRAIEDRIAAICQAIADALPREMTDDYPFVPNFAGSSYYGAARIESLGIRIDIRVSDHEQVPGGGWCEHRGERMGDADWSIVVDSPDTPIPSATAIRRKVAALIAEQC
ncbi:MAG: hypothetical protein ACOC0P_00710 [Planctomycetota bacterium]